MSDTAGSNTFRAGGAAAYDGFMGRYSRPLAHGFLDVAGVSPGLTALDVGCGPGALTAVLVERLGADRVAACDPTEPFVAECRRRHPGVDVRAAAAEDLPFDDDSADLVLAQLVLHFVSDPTEAATQMRRVARPGGVVGACVWDFDEGMEMLRLFWDAALAVNPDAPDEARAPRFGGPGEIAGLFEHAGLSDVRECTLEVSSTYADLDELWQTLLAGVGPAGGYLIGRPAADRDRVRSEMRTRVERRFGSADAPFTLRAVARAAFGLAP